MAIQIEKNGERIYREAVQKIDDTELAGLLKWMADEEARHAKWFEDLKNQWDPSNDNPLADEMSRQLFAQVIGDRNFSLKEVNFTAIRSTDQLIRLFIEFENDSILFYELIQPFVEGEQTKQMFKRIILEEHRHIERLKEVLDSDKDKITERTGLT